MTVKDMDRATWDTAVRRITRTFYDPGRAAAFNESAQAAWRKATDFTSAMQSHDTLLESLLASMRASHTARFTPDMIAYYEALSIYGEGRCWTRVLRKLFPPDGVVTYEGIGWRIRAIDGRIFAAAIYDGGPASRAGILLGDEVVSIDGVAPTEIESFRGRSGQAVNLRIRRSPAAAVITLDVIPEHIEPTRLFLSAMRDSVRIIERDGRRIGCIRPWSYAGEEYQALLGSELSVGRLKDVDALVLDLRDGWGGASPEYAELFVGGAPTMTFIGRTGRKRIASFRWTRPLVVVIDEATRSGKEVLAWTLQRRRVCLVGTRTAGAVLAGEASILPDGSLLIVAVQDVRLDGVRLEGLGVAPDVTVPLHLPYAAGDDPQIDMAVYEAAQRCNEAGPQG